MVTKGGRRKRDKLDKLGVWDKHIHNTIYKINNKVPVYNTGNYMQYPAINHNGKEYEREYVYIKLNHFAVHQKLKRHCKSTIFQFKKRIRICVLV